MRIHKKSNRQLQSFIRAIGASAFYDIVMPLRITEPVVTCLESVSNKKEMEPCKAERYKARTTVERTNSELKECFLPGKLYSRGKKGIFQIELSILMLDIKKISARLRAESIAQKTA